MGVLPLQFLPGESAASLGLTGRESFDILGLARWPRAAPAAAWSCARDGEAGDRASRSWCRLDGPIELDYYRQGGILPAVLRRLATA